MYFRLLILCAGLNFCACVSSSRYHSVSSERDQLSIQLKESQVAKDSLEVLALELETTKMQLQKTENVLIEFYLKYHQGSEKSDSVNQTNQLVNEQEESTIQESSMIEIKRLNDQLIKLRNEYEQLSDKHDKLLKSKEIKKSTAKKLDSLNKEIVALKNAVAKEKANQVIQDRKLKASYSLMDSMTSQIQFGEIRIKQLQYELNEVKQELDAMSSSKGVDQKLQESEFKTEINQLKSSLDELNRLNAQMLETVQLKDKEIQKSLEKIAALKDENDQTRQELANLKIKEKSSIKEDEYKAVQEELRQHVNTINALNEIIEDKNHQIQKHQAQGIELERKLKDAEAQIHTSNSRSMKLEQSDSIKNVQEMNLKSLSGQNQDLLYKIEGSEREKEQLQNQLKLLKLELISLDRLKDSIHMQQTELVRLKKTHSEELSIANSRLKNRQASLDSLNVKFKALQESNKQLQLRALQPSSVNNQKEATPPVETKEQKQEIQSKDLIVQPNLKSNAEGTKKRLSEAIITQLRSLIKSYPSIEFETSLSKDQGLILIPWQDLFDPGSFAIKESGANLIADLSSTIKQNKKIRIIFVKDNLNQTNMASSDKRINTLKKLMQVYGVSSQQLSEGTGNPENPKWQTNTEQVAMIVYTE